jgi:DNA-binding MarR family transcriptional regulator
MTETDRIDRFVEDMRRELPHLDPGYAEVLGRIERLNTLHHAATLHAYTRRYGLSAAEFDVLLALRLAGAPFEQSPTALANAMIVTSGGMTARLDRLEGAGLVTRGPRPADRRGSLVRLTERGRDLVETSIADAVPREARLLDALTVPERRELARLLKKLLLADPFHTHDPHLPARERAAARPR